jgi:hypothetical protein
MTRKQRRQYGAAHIEREQRLENRFVPGIRRLLSKQIKFFISQYKKDPRAAVAQLRQQLYMPDFTKVLTALYKRAVVDFGVAYYRYAIMEAAKPVKKESAAFGFNEQWNYAIIDFLSHHLLERAVLPITATTKKLLMDVLDQGQENGWSVERIFTELRKVDQLSAVRARRIIRTELAIAANFAQNLADDELDFETQTEWITAHDHRVRSSHRAMDGQIVDTGQLFTVPMYKGKKQIGTEQMTGPGDPTASAGNVINCRCTRAPVPKRDAQGNLIEKQKPIIPQSIKL